MVFFVYILLPSVDGIELCKMLIVKASASGKTTIVILTICVTGFAVLQFI